MNLQLLDLLADSNLVKLTDVETILAVVFYKQGYFIGISLMSSLTLILDSWGYIKDHLHEDDILDNFISQLRSQESRQSLREFIE